MLRKKLLKQKKNKRTGNKTIELSKQKATYANVQSENINRCKMKENI